MHLRQGRVCAGRYEIMEQIGAGGMAIVYRAKDLKLDRFVTFKALRAEHRQNDAFRERFKTEARAIAMMNHPNIVDVYDVGNEDDIYFIVMEYIGGETLKELILKRAPFDNEEAVGVALQVAAALSHAHRNGVIHRDIKPQNILVTPDGTVKVADFGIARSADSQGAERDGSTLGSVHYIAPEQARGGQIGAKSDLYALGILMFEMLTGALPFDADNAAEIAAMHLHDPMPDVRALNPEAFESVAAVIQKLTQKDPERRYEDAGRLMEDLKLAMIRPDGKPESGSWKLEAGKERKERKDRNESPARGGVKLERGMEMKITIAAVVTALLVVALLAAIILPRALKKEPEVVVVPHLAGVIYAEARAELERAGVTLDVSEEAYSDEYEAGVILAQDMPEGTNLSPGDGFGVTVSKGVEQFAVPDLTGKPLEAIRDMRLPFAVIEGEYEYSDDVPKNAVVAQSPEAGSLLPKNGQITLTVSRGAEMKRVTVPDVLGMTEAEAKTKISGMGLVVGQITHAPSERFEEGKVAAQSPGGGREALAGGQVGITISSGKPTPPPAPEPTATPDPAAPAAPGQDETPREKLIVIEKPNVDIPLESVQLTIARKDDGGLFNIYNERVTADSFPIKITVTGVGVQEFQFFVEGIYVADHTVDFRE